MSKHTPEPWALSSESQRIIVEAPAFEGASSLRLIGSTCGHPDSWAYPTEEAGYANALRIVSCVNACAGMEDPDKEIAELRRQRDELLTELDKLANGYAGNGWDIGLSQRLGSARELVKKSKGAAS